MLKNVLLVCFLAIIPLSAPAQEEPAAGHEKYLADLKYCEKDADCALREGVCSKQPMNIYFDNSPLIDMQPMVKCVPNVEYTHVRCEAQPCIGDMTGRPAPLPEALLHYLSDRHYCQKNEDCALRQGACTKEPMNVYFDNTELAESGALIDCVQGLTFSDPHCDLGKCIADLQQTHSKKKKK